jgi:hypothetical protein
VVLRAVWPAVVRQLCSPPGRTRESGTNSSVNHWTTTFGCKWEHGIRMDLGEISWGCVEWTQLAQDRGRWRAVVNAMMNLGLLHHGVSY